MSNSCLHEVSQCLFTKTDMNALPSAAVERQEQVLEMRENVAYEFEPEDL